MISTDLHILFYRVLWRTILSYCMSILTSNLLLSSSQLASLLFYSLFLSWSLYTSTSFSLLIRLNHSSLGSISHYGSPLSDPIWSVRMLIWFVCSPKRLVGIVDLPLARHLVNSYCFSTSHHVLSPHILLCLNPSHIIPSYHISFYPIFSYPISSCHIPFRPIMSHSIISYPISLYPFMLYPISSYLIRSDIHMCLTIWHRLAGHRRRCIYVQKVRTVYYTTLHYSILHYITWWHKHDLIRQEWLKALFASPQMMCHNRRYECISYCHFAWILLCRMWPIFRDLLITILNLPGCWNHTSRLLSSFISSFLPSLFPWCDSSFSSPPVCFVLLLFFHIPILPQFTPSFPCLIRLLLPSDGY